MRDDEPAAGFYGKGILGGPIDLDGNSRRPVYPKVEAIPGLAVEQRGSGLRGVVVALAKGIVTLRDPNGRDRQVRLRDGGFMVERRQVTLIPPTADSTASVGRTASGSVAVAGAAARVARASRILVEGLHDAELVEKVWGDDLRIEGVVVEMLDGVDDLAAVIGDFQPAPGRRLGVLVDHLVPGTKETRLVEQARALSRYAPYVKILGHPYVDVWQSVRPERLGLQRWPVIPRGQSWKHGIVAELGWAHETQTDIAHAWKRILATVRTYADLEPTLLASVEELIDFVATQE